jgi:hypothetical protein
MEIDAAQKGKTPGDACHHCGSTRHWAKDCHLRFDIHYMDADEAKMALKDKHQFKIWTDHKNLEYFMSAKQLNGRQAQWSLYLTRFDFLLHHRPSKSMGKPDMLSWRAEHRTGADDNPNITPLTPKLFAAHMLEGLEFASSELNILCDIRKGVKNPVEEPIAKAAGQLQKSSTRSLHSREWSDRDGLLYFHGCIYVPPDSDLCHCIISLCHDTKVARHARRFKTLELVSC